MSIYTLELLSKKKGNHFQSSILSKRIENVLPRRTALKVLLMSSHNIYCYYLFLCNISLNCSCSLFSLILYKYWFKV